ncbi:hydrolase 76 protein, partial [Physocladia obscura]
AVMAAGKAAMSPLKMFFAAYNADDGAWIEQFEDGHYLIQWHESGIYWDLFYNYMKWSGDTSYLNFVDSNIQLSAGSNDDFLNGQSAITELSGRWNDDIGWWGLATMTAAETFGQSAIVAPNNLQSGFNPTYFSLTNVTVYEMFLDWDTACGGGIYWSRDRNSTATNDALYKSTITNAEAMDMLARMYKMTQIADYKTRFDQVYAWLKSSGIITSTYVIYDGVYTSSCSSPSTEVYSYHNAELMSAHSIMYEATNDGTYLTEATNIFNGFVTQFVNSTDNTYSIEPDCPPSTCPKSPSGYNFPGYRALVTLFNATSDSTVRSQISTILTASAAANFQLCDSNWYCIRNLPAGTEFALENGTNIRDQFETVAILNALTVIVGGCKF